MAHTFSINVNANDSKQSATHDSILSPVPSKGLNLFITDGVDLYRQVEIFTAFKFLLKGIRDRNYWSDRIFPAGTLYSGVPIGNATTTLRRTSINSGDVLVDDHIAIGIGPDLRVSIVEGAPDMTIIYEAFFVRLIDFAKESGIFKYDGAAPWDNVLPPNTAFEIIPTASGYSPGESGTYTIQPLRFDAVPMEAHTVQGTFATEADLIDALTRNTPTSWKPYYKVYDYAGRMFINSVIDIASHDEFQQTWVAS